MQKGFESDLRSVNEIEKIRQDKIKSGLDDIQEVYTELANRLNTTAENQETSIETQKKILEIQRKKLKIMNRLRESLICLDDPECKLEEIAGARLASYDDVAGSFVYENERGQKNEGTLGEIITDLDWDIEYQLDTATTPRHHLKMYLVERAKNQLRSLLDRQILESEIGSDETADILKDTYQVIKDKRENHDSAHGQAGFIAETVVRNFLRQLSIDKDLPFEIRVSDVQQDVELKMDFVIHKKQEAVGVDVEAAAQSDVAIQYSLNDAKRQHKEKQIRRTEEVLQRDNEEHIKHIALVIFPIEDTHELNLEWKRSGKIAGGPGKFLSANVKQKLFFELLEDVFSVAEIEKFWEKAQ